MDAYVRNSRMNSGLTIYALQIKYFPTEVCVYVLLLN